MLHLVGADWTMFAVGRSRAQIPPTCMLSCRPRATSSIKLHALVSAINARALKGPVGGCLRMREGTGR
jgi:hypothetical protein